MCWGLGVARVPACAALLVYFCFPASPPQVDSIQPVITLGNPFGCGARDAGAMARCGTRADLRRQMRGRGATERLTRRREKKVGRKCSLSFILLSYKRYIQAAYREPTPWPDPQFRTPPAHRPPAYHTRPWPFRSQPRIVPFQTLASRFRSPTSILEDEDASSAPPPLPQHMHAASPVTLRGTWRRRRRAHGT
jgi:hypothetical protein